MPEEEVVRLLSFRIRSEAGVTETEGREGEQLGIKLRADTERAECYRALWPQKGVWVLVTIQ